MQWTTCPSKRVDVSFHHSGTKWVLQRHLTPSGWGLRWFREANVPHSRSSFWNEGLWHLWNDKSRLGFENAEDIFQDFPPEKSWKTLAFHQRLANSLMESVVKRQPRSWKGCRIARHISVEILNEIFSFKRKNMTNSSAINPRGMLQRRWQVASPQLEKRSEKLQHTEHTIEFFVGVEREIPRCELY